MDLVTTSTNEGTMPPLVVVDQTNSTSMKQLAPNTVQTFMLKKVSPNKSKVVELASPPKASTSNMTNVRIVQTAAGKKLLLTNVVGTSKASINGSVVMMSKRGLNTPTATANSGMLPTTSNSVQLPTTAGQSVVSPAMSINAPQTIILNSLHPTEKNDPSTTGTSILPIVPPINQPVILKIPGINQPVVIKPFTTNPDDIVNKLSPRLTQQLNTGTVKTCMPPVNATTENRVPFAALQSDSSNPVMYLKSGNSTYKVVGKPVPVQLHPNLPHIAPKVIMNEVAGTGTIQKIPLPPLRSAKKHQNIKILTPIKGTPSAVPPAYLNICVSDLVPATEQPNTPYTTMAKPKTKRKRKASVGPITIEVPTISVEPMALEEEEIPQIKEEELTEDPPEEMSTSGGVLESMLDVKIKEEPKDDQTGELLARDEQLREVLGIPSKFYIRTSEGKLVTITHEEARALGLDHQDKVENNQKKLMNALSFIKNSPLYKGIAEGDTQFDDSLLYPETGDVKIPENVNIQDYVSRHVDPAAEKNASLMKALGQKRVEMFNKDMVSAQTNTAVIGEYYENDRHFLRLEIEMEPRKRNICDIVISPLNLFQCPFCIKEFKTKDHIISHLRIHTGERPYPCDVCGKRYRQRIDIIRHMRIHTGEKPFTCGLCDASFNQKSNLRSHMRIHTGERPVQCNVCGKGFSRNTHLKQHMKLHTGEKPYQCKVCYRPFRFKSGLQAHERIHSGMKPYACSLCGRSFTQIVGLLRHERTHVGEKPFRCQSCGKSFNNRESLKAHVMKHTSARPYACDICEKTFTDRAALRCHRKKYHSDNLICVLCLREDFKDRIDLREHLRQHERSNWKETSDGVLVPIVRNLGESNLISVDDTTAGTSEDDGGYSINGIPENIQIDVDVEPAISVVNDNLQDDDDDSEYEEHELYIPSQDPLA